MSAYLYRSISGLDRQLGFGKFARETPLSLSKTKPTYLVWLYDSGWVTFTTKEVARAFRRLVLRLQGLSINSEETDKEEIDGIGS